MKDRILGLLLGLAVTVWIPSAGAQAPPNAEILTNASVIQLVESKLSRNLVIAKIRESQTAFDITAAGLVALHQRKIPKAIIQAMIQASESTPTDEVLTNQSVFQMVEAKLPRDLIIGKIHGSRTAFDVSTSGLVAIQQRKIPRPIIEAMLQASSSP